MTTGPSAAVTGYVLAGGRSSRMGEDKALLEVEGVPLIAHALAKLHAVCADVAILAGPPATALASSLAAFERVLTDAEGESSGPLAGVLAALADCPTPYALLTPIDQPTLPASALTLLIEQGVAAGTAAACLEHQARPEPLPLLLSSHLQVNMQRLFQSGERRLLASVRAAAQAFGRDLLVVRPPEPSAAADWFLNLNTPQDLQQWQQARKASTHLGSGASEKPYG